MKTEQLEGTFEVDMHQVKYAFKYNNRGIWKSIEIRIFY
jgi:hypothetical protein